MATGDVSVGGIVEDFQFREHRLLRNLGETLTATMIPAFARDESTP